MRWLHSRDIDDSLQFLVEIDGVDMSITMRNRDINQEVEDSCIGQGFDSTHSEQSLLFTTGLISIESNGSKDTSLSRLHKSDRLTENSVCIWPGHC